MDENTVLDCIKNQLDFPLNNGNQKFLEDLKKLNEILNKLIQDEKIEHTRYKKDISLIPQNCAFKVEDFSIK